VSLRRHNRIHAHEPWSLPSLRLEALAITACPRSACLHRCRGGTKGALPPHRCLPARGAPPLHAVFSSSSSTTRPLHQPPFLLPRPSSLCEQAPAGVDGTRTKRVGPWAWSSSHSSALADAFNLPHHLCRRFYIKEKRKMCMVEGERRKEITVWMLLMEREGKKCWLWKEISAPWCVECCLKR
jgi:hypothetical protein